MTTNVVEAGCSQTLILDATAESIVVTDLAGTVVYVNSAFERLTGFQRDDIDGKQVRLVTGGDQPELLQSMWETLARGETWSANYRNRRKDGSVFHQHTSVSPVRDAGGTITHYVGVGRDIGREVVLESRLAQALRHTETVVNASSLGILTYRSNGDAISANLAAAEMIGGTVAQLEAQNFRTIKAWNTSGLTDAGLTALATGCAQHVEAKMTTSFGKTVIFESLLLPFEFEGERQLMAMFNDITERRKLEAKFQQAQKMEAIGLLAGGIAHDFNNILAVIMSFGALACEGLADGDTRRGDLDEGLKAAAVGASLTQQLLLFSRQGPSEKRPTDLNKNVTDIAKFLARAVGERVRVSVIPCSQPVTVSIDPVRFDQVLLNLAVNARDAMPDGGKLEIALDHVTTHDGTFAHLSVTDTGIGMDEATRQRIFEPFFTTKERGKGTGLGLATCFGIVADVGGSIRVDSVPMQGTTFTIELPTCAPSVATIEQAHAVRARGHGERVLVVEDEPALRAATVRALEASGYAVMAATDGREAIRKIDELGGALDSVLSDVVMPGCSGHEVADYCAARSPRTAVILTSGYHEEVARRGGHRILQKPVPVEELMLAVADSLARVTSRAAVPLLDREQRERVLVVDDDDALARSTKRILEASGFAVTIARSVTAARAVLERERVDVMVTDLAMPDGSGLDLVRAARATLPDLPVVMMTGGATVESAAAAMRGQVREYLEKPVSTAELRRAVHAAAEAGRTTRLRAQLLPSRHDDFLRDLGTTERSFAAALGSLRMVYQPIVRARGGEIFAYEALLRSGVPALASAPLLLSAAEALGRVDALGRAVRAAVASTITHHPDRVESIFVNLHPSELRRPLLADATDPLLQVARRVVLEVTEQAPIETGPPLDAKLAQIRELGYRLAIDDLGEGYSGLASLVHLRPDFAKIDMALVRDVHRAAIKRDIIAAVVDIAHRSNIEVIAEGVETADERAVLVELGCDLLQGYLVAMPGLPFAVTASPRVTA